MSRPSASGPDQTLLRVGVLLVLKDQDVTVTLSTPAERTMAAAAGLLSAHIWEKARGTAPVDQVTSETALTVGAEPAPKSADKRRTPSSDRCLHCPASGISMVMDPTPSLFHWRKPTTSLL